MKIYHNPRCSKSRQTLQILKQAGVDVEVIEYLKTPPTAEELGRLLDLLGLEPHQLMRKKESVYADLGLRDRSCGREEAIRLMVEHPQLIERPIVISGNRAVIGRPPESVRELL